MVAMALPGHLKSVVAGSKTAGSAARHHFLEPLHGQAIRQGVRPACALNCALHGPYIHEMMPPLSDDSCMSGILPVCISQTAWQRSREDFVCLFKMLYREIPGSQMARCSKTLLPDGAGSMLGAGCAGCRISLTLSMTHFFTMFLSGWASMKAWAACISYAPFITWCQLQTQKTDYRAALLTRNGSLAAYLGHCLDGGICLEEGLQIWQKFLRPFFWMNTAGTYIPTT